MIQTFTQNERFEQCLREIRNRLGIALVPVTVSEVFRL